MAELMNNDGVVVRTKSEGFATWLLKLYVLCFKFPNSLLNDEIKKLFSEIFEIMSVKIEKQRRLTGPQLAMVYEIANFARDVVQLPFDAY